VEKRHRGNSKLCYKEMRETMGRILWKLGEFKFSSRRQPCLIKGGLMWIQFFFTEHVYYRSDLDSNSTEETLDSIALLDADDS
jgi:hypothetical protein